MKYSVLVINPSCNKEIVFDRGYKNQVISFVKKYIKEHPEDLVYVIWNRSSDGQTGYLNPCGNNDINGRNWREV